MKAESVIIRTLAKQEYTHCWQAMRQFTDSRNENSTDEIWVVEHEPVFTQGQNGKAEHILNPGTIPVIQVDRGGQVTYHGPGQLVIYPLVDIRRKKLNVRELVTLLENAVIHFLNELGIVAYSKKTAPGVYIDQSKICSIGLRIRKGCSYHGLAFNIAMDLEPFTRINPCGFSQLKMTQLSELGITLSVSQVGEKLVETLISHFNYSSPIYVGTTSCHSRGGGNPFLQKMDSPFAGMTGSTNELV